MARHGKELSKGQKQTILSMHEKKLSGRKIADLTNISRATIQKFLKRYGERGNVENLQRVGRPKISGERDYHVLSRLVHKNRRQSLSDLTVALNETIPVPISETTVKRKLKRLAFKRCTVRKTITISAHNRTKRVSWCRERKHWTVEQNWSNIIFSDETKVVLDKDQKIYVWRKHDEAWNSDCLGMYSAHSPRKNVSAMFWGCLTINGVGILTPVDGKIDSEKYIGVLDDHLWPVITKSFPNGGWALQEDNCPVHTSRRTSQWKTENRIPTLTWPPHSPDINIIENVWRKIKIELSKRLVEIKSKGDLIRTVSWSSLNKRTIPVPSETTSGCDKGQWINYQIPGCSGTNIRYLFSKSLQFICTAPLV